MTQDPQAHFELYSTAALRSRFARRRNFLTSISIGKSQRFPTKAQLLFHATCLVVLLGIWFTSPEITPVLLFLVVGNFTLFILKCFWLLRSEKQKALQNIR